jgi:hypothetical protein
MSRKELVRKFINCNRICSKDRIIKAETKTHRIYDSIEVGLPLSGGGFRILLIEIVSMAAEMKIAKM